METNDFLIVALTSAIGGISIDYCIQAIVNNDRDTLGLNQDKQTFGTSVLSSCLAIISDILFLSSEGLYSAIVAIVLLIVWIIQLVLYFIRKKVFIQKIHSITYFSLGEESMSLLGIQIKLDKINRNRDIARGIIFLVLSSATILMHILSDSFNS